MEICGVQEQYCVCALPPGHPEDYHECDQVNCLGRWPVDWSQDNALEVLRFPKGPFGDLMNFMIRGE